MKRTEKEAKLFADRATPDDIRVLIEGLVTLTQEINRCEEDKFKVNDSPVFADATTKLLELVEKVTRRKIPNTKRSAGLVKAGDLFILPTQAQTKLVEAGLAIQQEPDAIEKAYLARELVQCTLPHSDPGDVPLWIRTNGNLTLVVARTGMDSKTGKPIGYPYGAIPRLLMYWMNTEAVQTGNRRLELGNTFSKFLRDVGIDSSQGGPRSSYRKAKDQMRRLFSASIGFTETTTVDGRDRERKLNMNVTAASELWWSPKHPDQAHLWGSWIELGEKFFNAITAFPVPADLRALQALKKSPLALDLYCWATHKAYSTSTKGKDQFVPWVGLKSQFGADYKDPNDFRKKAITALKKIQTVYPGLKLRDAEGGITVLASSRPAVPPGNGRLLES